VQLIEKEVPPLREMWTENFTPQLRYGAPTTLGVGRTAWDDGEHHVEIDDEGGKSRAIMRDKDGKVVWQYEGKNLEGALKDSPDPVRVKIQSIKSWGIPGGNVQVYMAGPDGVIKEVKIEEQDQEKQEKKEAVEKANADF
jgi:hypothetical protein